MNEFAVFYHTCDKYSDLWEHFCYFFKKYWPDYDGKIYVNSEEKDFSYPGLNIINLKVGKMDFAKREIAGVSRVTEPYILLMMDDLFLMGKVETEAFDEYFNYFKSANADSLVFRKFSTYEVTIPVNVREAEVVIPPSVDMFTSQLALWKKESFLRYLNEDDGPWETEYFGTMRANLSHLKLICTAEKVIPSISEGGLHYGKWVQPMIDFLNEENYHEIDFSKRGIYKPVKRTLKERIKFKVRSYTANSRRQIFKMVRKARKYYWQR